MKKLFERIRMPEFLEDMRMRYAAIAMVVLAVIGILMGALIRPWLALLMLLILISLVATIFYALETIAKNTNQYISDLSYRIKRGEQEALIKMPIGILIYDENLNIEWTNPFLQKYFGDTDVLGQPLEHVDAELAELIRSNENTNETKMVTWGQHQFEIIVQKSIGVVYLMDVTRYAEIEERAEDEKIAIGQIFIDNYDEITQTMDDQVITNLNSYVTNQLTDWANQFGMFLKRIDNDRFFLLAYAKSLKDVERDKFKILDVIREETSKQNYPLTLSLGIAYGDEDLAQLAVTSQSNLDLALGRGGDQVVVRAKGHEARFYGGKTNPMEKRTRVRARMVAQALQE